MYADYVVWNGGSGGLVDDFFNGVGGDPPTGRGKFGDDCSSPTWSLTLTLKCGPNPNPNLVMSVSYSLAQICFWERESHSIGLMYRKNVAPRCECSIPTAE